MVLPGVLCEFLWIIFLFCHCIVETGTIVWLTKCWNVTKFDRHVTTSKRNKVQILCMPLGNEITNTFTDQYKAVTNSSEHFFLIDSVCFLFVIRYIGLSNKRLMPLTWVFRIYYSIHCATTGTQICHHICHLFSQYTVASHMINPKIIRIWWLFFHTVSKSIILWTSRHP